MPITIPNVPDKWTYAVVAAAGISALVAVLAAVAGLVISGLIALALGGAIYWFIYRNLAGDPMTAKRVALIVAALYAFFALVSIALHLVLGFLLDAAAAACLGWIFFELNRRRTARG